MTVRRIARPVGTGAALCALALGLLACGQTHAPRGGAEENVVRAALGADPASLSLIGKADRNTEKVAVQLTDSLVQYDPQMRLRPRVAVSWEFSEDRRVLTFHLREGVRWHDGVPVTADDVKFTVDEVRKPAVESRTYATGLRDVERVEVVDERTVRVAYRRATPGALDAWRVPLIPRHAAEGDEDLMTGRFAAHPIGCGPFRFVSYRPSREIVLEANDDYWDGRPAIDRLVFKIFPEKRTAYQALLRGDLDLLTVSGAQWAEARDSPDARRLRAFVYSSLNVWPVIWNEDGSNPFFTDPRVRRAMVYALDREAFIDTVAHGQARPGATTFHPESFWADPSIAPRPYDPERAERLLGEAGWRDTDGDGVRDRDGRPFRFTLLIPHSAMELTRQIAAWQQSSWARVGVIAEVEQLEWQAFRELRNAGQFEAVSFSLSFTPEPDQFYDLYHSSAREGGFNFYGLADSEIDRLLERARETFDVEARLRLYRALQRRLFDLEPITCTFFFSHPVLLDRRLLGVVPSPLDHWRTTQGPRVWHWADRGR